MIKDNKIILLAEDDSYDAQKFPESLYKANCNTVLLRTETGAGVFKVLE